MKENLQYYCLELDDYAAPSFCSFNKPYFGTLDEIASLINALEHNEYYKKSHSKLISAFKEYLGGNRSVTHNVAYNEVLLLTPVSIYAEMSVGVKANDKYEHMNIWDCSYYLCWKSSESHHIWLKYKSSYFRCMRVKFNRLELENLDGVYEPLEYADGFPEMIEITENSASNRLNVVEKIFETEAELLSDIINFKNEPKPDFTEFFNDIFGDS